MMSEKERKRKREKYESSMCTMDELSITDQIKHNVIRRAMAYRKMKYYYYVLFT